MTSFQSREALCIEACNQMSNGITTLSPCKLGRISEGVTICHGKHFFGMDHLIGRLG